MGKQGDAIPEGVTDPRFTGRGYAAKAMAKKAALQRSNPPQPYRGQGEKRTEKDSVSESQSTNRESEPLVLALSGDYVENPSDFMKSTRGPEETETLGSFPLTATVGGYSYPSDWIDLVPIQGVGKKVAWYTLSQHLRKSAFDSHRISAVEKGITEIDEVLEKYYKVETIFLSNNSIRDLRHILQFYNLRTLSIASNLIAEVDQLDFLAELPNLVNLNVDGNPISQIPHYRYHVLNRLPHLKVLDGKDVTPVERKVCGKFVKKEMSTLNMMFSNECLIRKLQQGILKVKLHMELRAVVFGRVSILNRADLPPLTKFDSRRYLQLWDYESSISIPARKVAFGRLRLEVRSAFNLRDAWKSDALGNKSRNRKETTEEDKWDMAFSEVMLAQQNTISSLLSDIEELKDEVDKAHDAFKEYDPLNTIGRMRASEEAAQSRAREEREGLILEFRNQVQSLEAESRDKSDQEKENYKIQFGHMKREIDALQADAAFAHSPVQLRSFRQPFTQKEETQPIDLGTGHGGGEDVAVDKGFNQRDASTFQDYLNVVEIQDDDIQPNSAQQSHRLAQNHSHSQPSSPSQPRNQVSQSHRRTSTKEKSVAAAAVPKVLAQSAPSKPMALGGSSNHNAQMGRVAKPPGASASHGPKKVAPSATRKPLTRSMGVAGGATLEDSRTLALKKQVEMLQKEIEQRIAGEQKLHQVNLQLREKLQQYQQQNTENVERAEQELMALHNDMQQAIELQNSLEEKLRASDEEKRRLESMLKEKVREGEMSVEEWKKRASSLERGLDSTKTESVYIEEEKEHLRAELTRVGSQNEKLENMLADAKADIFKLSSETEFVKQKADEYSQELRKFIIVEQREEAGQRFRTQHLMRTMFNYFKEATGNSKVEQLQNALAIGHARQRIGRQYLRKLRSRSAASVMARSAARRRSLEASLRCFHSWTFFTLVGRQCFISKQRKNAELRLQYFLGWRHYLLVTQRHKENERLSTLVHEKFLRRRSFHSWEKYTYKRVLTEKEEVRLMSEHQSQFQDIKCRSYLTFWARWHRQVGRPHTRKNKVASNFHAVSLVSVTFKCWRRLRQVVAQTRHKKDGARVHYAYQLGRRFVQQWSSYIARRRVVDAQHAQADGYLEKLHWKKWRKAFAAVERFKRNEVVATHSSIRMRRRRLFRAWGVGVELKKRSRHLKVVALRSYFYRLQKSTHWAWKRAVALCRVERMKLREVNLNIQRKVYHEWFRFMLGQKVFRRCCVNAERFYRRYCVREAQKIIDGWQSVVQGRHKLKQVHSVIATRQAVKTKRLILNNWQRFVHLQFRESFKQMRDHCGTLQKTVEDSGDRATTVDLENLQLVDRLHAVTSEVSNLRVQLSQKEEERNDLEKSLEEAAIVENSLRTEIERLQAKESSWEEDVRNFQKQINDKAEEYTTASVQHTMQRQQLEHQIFELRRMYQEREGQLESTEKALRVAVEKLESGSSESQEKLQTAFEIAASLRKLLEDKEHRLAELSTFKEHQDVQLTDYQQRLLLQNRTMAETLDERNHKIADLQKQIGRLNNQVSQSSTKVHEYSSLLDDRNTEIKRLRYELKLLSDREDNKTEAFLQELNQVYEEDLNLQPHGHGAPSSASTRHLPDSSFATPQSLSFQTPTPVTYQDQLERQIRDAAHQSTQISKRDEDLKGKEKGFESRKYLVSEAYKSAASSNPAPKSPPKSDGRRPLQGDIAKLQQKIMSRLQTSNVSSSSKANEEDGFGPRSSKGQLEDMMSSSRIATQHLENQRSVVRSEIDEKLKDLGAPPSATKLSSSMPKPSPSSEELHRKVAELHKKLKR